MKFIINFQVQTVVRRDHTGEVLGSTGDRSVAGVQDPSMEFLEHTSLAPARWAEDPEIAVEKKYTLFSLDIFRNVRMV